MRNKDNDKNIRLQFERKAEDAMRRDLGKSKPQCQHVGGTATIVAEGGTHSRSGVVI